MVKFCGGHRLHLLLCLVAAWIAIPVLSFAQDSGGYIQNIEFAEDDGGAFISFDWMGVPNSGDTCSDDPIAVWLNRHNPNGRTQGLFIPAPFPRAPYYGDFQKPNVPSYSGFGNYSFASGMPSYGCFGSGYDIQLAGALPARVKAYVGLSGQFTKDDFITVQLIVHPFWEHLGNPWIGWSDQVEYHFKPKSVPKNPVIIVPGIMGSRLNRVSDGEEVWPNINKMISPVNLSDAYLDELILRENGVQIFGKEMNPSSVIDTERVFLIVERIFYKNLIDKLVLDGYVPNLTLFAFPYDWRFEISKSSEKLHEFISTAIEHSETGKVDIIAHSMGGLVLKQYLASATDTISIDKRIFLGVPQLGAPKTFQLLNYGDDMGLRKWIFGLNPNKAKEIAQNMPGVYQLLPSRQYLQLNPASNMMGSGNSYIVDFREKTPKFLTYDETENLMLADRDDIRNGVLLDKADVFHGILDVVGYRTTSTYEIIGCKNPSTVGSYRIYDGEKILIDYTAGDGTVPAGSAMSEGLYNTADRFGRYYVTDPRINHTDLVRDDRILDLVGALLKGETPTLPSVISESKNDCVGTFSSAAHFQVSTHSPVALHLYNTEGMHTGPMPNGDVEYGVPESDYWKIGENSYVRVPAGEGYRIVVKSTGVGSFDMRIAVYDGTTISSTAMYVGVPLMSTSTNGLLSLEASNIGTDLHMDNDGDGVIESTIHPISVLNSILSQDVAPPEITLPTIPAEPILGTRGIFNFSVNDDLSGIALTTATFDGNLVTQNEEKIFTRVGTHLFHMKSVDKAGNPRIEETNFNAVYKFGGFSPPLQSGISYNQGRVIPIKFRLFDANGNSVKDAQARLYITRMQGGIMQTELPATSIQKTRGNLFQYDEAGKQYVFQLTTKNMSIGEWKLRLELDDGKSYEMLMQLK